MAEDIRLCPLTSYAAATMPGDSGMLDLEFVRTPEELETGVRHRLRLAMSRAQARELGQMILRMAEMPHIPQPPTEARH